MRNEMELVKDMCLTEYSETEAMELFKEEGRLEGRKEGRLEGRKEGRLEGRKEGSEDALVSSLKKLMKNLNLSVESAMDSLEIPIEQRSFYMKLVNSR